MAVISFYEVDFSFDMPYLQKSLAESQAALKQIVQRHLTDKSLGRIDDVFAFFSDPTLLETSFRSESPYRDVVGKIVADLNQAMDNGDLWILVIIQSRISLRIFSIQIPHRFVGGSYRCDSTQLFFNF